jgi:hypothetical protein
MYEYRSTIRSRLATDPVLQNSWNRADSSARVGRVT